MAWAEEWPWSRPGVPLAVRAAGRSAVEDVDSALGPAYEWLCVVLLVVGHLLLNRSVDYVSICDILSMEHVQINGLFQRLS